MLSFICHCPCLSPLMLSLLYSLATPISLYAISFACLLPYACASRSRLSPLHFHYLWFLVPLCTDTMLIIASLGCFFFFFWVTTLISLDLVKTNPTYFFSLQHKLKKTSLFIGREISGNSSFRFCISFVLSNKKLKRPSSQNKIIIGRRSFSQLFSFL